MVILQVSTTVAISVSYVFIYCSNSPIEYGETSYKSTANY